MVVPTSALDDARLMMPLMAAYWQGSDIAETAAADQLRSYLAEDPVARGQSVAQTSILFCATMMRATMRRHGCDPVNRWTLGRFVDGARYDPEVYEVIGDALEDELNHPGSAWGVVAAWLMDADIDAALTLSLEAIWVAAEIGRQTI
jgi:hypothetical protein